MKLPLVINIIIALAIALAVAAGLWWVRAGRDVSAPVTTPPALDEAALDETLTPEETPDPRREPGALVTAELGAVPPYTGSGTATRYFDGDVFTHLVTADLPDPAPDKFYEGWLVKDPATSDFFSTGRLVKRANLYTLTYTAEQDQPEYNLVVITEETASDGLDGKPEAHVLEGSF